MACVNNFCWTFVLVFLASITTGAYGRSIETNEDTISGFEVGAVIGGVASIVILVIVIAVCADRKVHVESLDRGPPYWTRSLVFKQEYNRGLTAVSDGMSNLSPFHVIRDRLGQAVTDGARWDVGFTEGKHVFEVVWPIKKNRGVNSSFGVCTIEVPLKKPGRLSLVGHHSQSWGFDLSSRKMVHANKRTGSFQKQIPDRFFLYVDLDAGKIGIGEDVKQRGRQALFYGNLINNVRLDKSKPLYLMIGMCSPREEVQIYYIGTSIPEGGFDLIPPAPVPGPPQDVVYGIVEQQQAPGPSQEEKKEGQSPPDAPPNPVVPPAPATY